MKKIWLTPIILIALFAQHSLVSSVYADATYTVGTDKTYAAIQAAINAITNDISGDLSGQGVQTVEVYAGGSHEGNGYFSTRRSPTAGSQTRARPITSC